jgi:hypothetical protein
MQAAISLFEHGVALTRWSGDDVVSSFRGAWRCSPFFSGARASLRSSAMAAGVPTDLLRPLEIGYFAQRLGRSLVKGDQTALGPPEFAAMLVTVCLQP